MEAKILYPVKNHIESAITNLEDVSILLSDNRKIFKKTIKSIQQTIGDLSCCKKLIERTIKNMKEGEWWKFLPGS